jgi:uridine kinase
MANLFIGIGGGTASGKTTLAAALALRLPKNQVQVVSLDWYYRNHSRLSLGERALINYDHPNAFDFNLLNRQLWNLRQHGRSVRAPSYDFATHARGEKKHLLKPGRTTIVEGILALHWPKVRDAFDCKVFVESDESVRFARRLKRDVAERGRTAESVQAQWYATVKPMYDEYCAPSSRWADVVVSGEAAIDDSVNKVRLTLRDLKLPALGENI